MRIEFKGKILIAGAGAVSQCLQYLLIRHLAIDFSRVTIVDPIDNRHRFQAFLERGATYIQVAITPQDYESFLSSLLSSGDLFIDLTVNLETSDLIEWCQKRDVLYINTSVEWWDPYQITGQSIDQTLYLRHSQLRERAKKWAKGGPTAIVEHGCNPGLVSHWTKSALASIATRILGMAIDAKRKDALQKALEIEDFPRLAYLTGTKVIHISERDSQISVDPKKVGEFVNTWSVYGFHEEATAPAELGWGTHEKNIPDGGALPFFGPRNEIILSEMGMNIYMRSWIPSGSIIGMLVRHGEAYSISNYLSLKENDKAYYRPTVNYVYLPTDAALASLHELKMHNYELQSKVRIMENDIIDGRDEVGVLLLGHDLNGWWTGSRLSIQETRALVPDQNATTLQVAASILGALDWMIKNPREGFKVPDDLPYKEILDVANPYLGTLVSTQTDWNPLKMRLRGELPIDEADIWQFQTFRVR